MNTSLPLFVYDMDIMAVYLNELYNIFARGSDAIVGNQAWQHSGKKKYRFPPGIHATICVYIIRSIGRTNL